MTHHPATRAPYMLLRTAAAIVPADMRRDWLREWTAEMQSWHGRRRLPRTLVLARCAGALAHAIWLRWDSWRFEMLRQDLSYALRTLTRKPGFAAITVLTLAVGIGANAAIFSAVRAVLFRPLPFPAPEQLVQISSTRVQAPQRPGGSASPPDFFDWRRHTTSFAGMAAINAGSTAWSGHGTAEQIPVASVTGGFFDVLQVAAAHGRTLTDADGVAGAEEVVVVSHALWTRRFGGDPTAVGRTMTLDGTSHRIIGIMPEAFSYPLQSELWMPLRFSADDLTTQRGAQYLDVIARLRPEVPRDAAQAEIAGLVARLAKQYPSSNGNKAVALFELREAMVGNLRPALLVLLGAVGFVLLIVCVNVASLALTRAVGRTRELAVRVALGAGRSRLIRGMLVESLVLAVAGGGTGLLLAAWATRGIARLDAAIGIPLLDQTRVDLPVLWFTFATALFAAVLFGTIPAFHASGGLDVARRIRDNASTLTAGKGRLRLRGGLIVLETALAVVLLVGAGLLLRSFIEMAAVDLALDPSRVQTFSVSLPETKYSTPPARAAFVEELLQHLGAHPDVEAAGAIFGLPLTGFSYGFTTWTLDGRQLSDAEQDERSIQARIVSPDLFRVLGIPVVRGRPFTTSDRIGAPPVVIVNRAAAASLWPGSDPLGRRFELGTRLSQGGARAGGEVVGVVDDVKELGPTGRVRPVAYFAHAQYPMDFITVTLKTRRDPTLLIEPARAVLAQMDADLPMYRVRTMEQVAANAVAQPRLYMLLLGLFAAVAVLLAALGIYGVLMHAVAERTREIGLRLALGATRAEVVGLVVRQAAGLAISGLAVGLVLAFAASRFLQSLLFEVSPGDVVTYASVAAGLLVIALLASYLPARRASRIDPISALRYE